ncbi:hypothetical protein EBI_24436 [Enterocytozoon bieneusi H348]|nr:hypothetical protein EBI_24436 [Enterocytozoon bieneusi H348]|eukprot:XP_002650012.1 hypothetical protein EBI_24436 [Enterocytozoon bieneusi H348]
MFLNIISLYNFNGIMAADDLHEQFEKMYPKLPSISEIDVFRYGILSSALRDSYKAKIFENAVCKNFIIKGLSIDEKCFEETVKKTSCDCLKKEFPKNNKQGEQVIRHIYNAARALKYTLDELMQFTATAMHNHNCFHSIVARPENPNTPEISRGLVQFTGTVGHNNIKQYLKGKEVRELDTFTFETIKAEMHCFKVKYMVSPKKETVTCKNPKFLPYINTIYNLAPSDAQVISELINKNSLISEQTILNTMASHQFARRLYLYLQLYKNVQICKRNVTVVINGANIKP